MSCKMSSVQGLIIILKVYAKVMFSSKKGSPATLLPARNNGQGREGVTYCRREKVKSVVSRYEIF